MSIDWKVLRWVILGVAVLLLVVAVVVGVQQLLLAAGLIGGAVGTGLLVRKVQGAKDALEDASEVAAELPLVVGQEKDKAESRVDGLTDAEKQALANRLLGGGDS